ncbi:MAG: c-type cytochrome domain-containing protein [Planctomycetota bacterium]
MKLLKNSALPLILLASALLPGSIVTGAEGGRKKEDSSKRGGAFQDEVSYTNDIRPLVANFCTTCHSGDDPEAKLRLTSYEAVRKEAEKGDLLERIEDAEDPMPQGGLMPKHMRRLFRVWAEQGYVNKGKKKARAGSDLKGYKLPKITPVDLGRRGGKFLTQMQGHWVGSMKLMGQEFPWFAFDYRAISPSHVHGIFEGGTIGNLFTSFFVARYRGRQTLMARNGGILNGIYRTSYFLLDKAEERGRKSTYRFVDAFGGKDVMWMELTFDGDRLEFKSYTSRFGLVSPPREHMRFVGKRKHLELSRRAAKTVGFPNLKTISMDLPKGLPKPDWGKSVPVTSASYLWEDASKSYEELGKIAGDPMRIETMPFLSRLTVTAERRAGAKGVKLLVYLSRESLTDRKGKFRTEFGYLRSDLADGLLLFPELSASQDRMTFTYLHPGDYYLTVIADVNDDGYPSPGDLSSASRHLVVKPRSHPKVSVRDINARN